MLIAAAGGAEVRACATLGGGRVRFPWCAPASTISSSAGEAPNLRLLFLYLDLALHSGTYHHSNIFPPRRTYGNRHRQLNHFQSASLPTCPPTYWKWCKMFAPAPPPAGCASLDNNNDDGKRYRFRFCFVCITVRSWLTIQSGNIQLKLIFFPYADKEKRICFVTNLKIAKNKRVSFGGIKFACYTEICAH